MIEAPADPQAAASSGICSGLYGTCGLFPFRRGHSFARTSMMTLSDMKRPPRGGPAPSGSQRDGVGAHLTDHVARRIGIATGNHRHDGRIGDAESLHAVD